MDLCLSEKGSIDYCSFQEVDGKGKWGVRGNSSWTWLSGSTNCLKNFCSGISKLVLSPKGKVEFKYFHSLILWSVTCVQLPHANSCSSFEWRIFYRWLFVWSTNPCTTVVRNLSSVSSGPRTSVSSETKARAPIAAVPEKKRCPERMGLLLREKWAVPHMGSLKAGALAILFQTGKREVGCGQLVRSVRGCAMIETSVSARC